MIVPISDITSRARLNTEANCGHYMVSNWLVLQKVFMSVTSLHGFAMLVWEKQICYDTFICDLKVISSRCAVNFLLNLYRRRRPMRVYCTLSYKCMLSSASHCHSPSAASFYLVQASCSCNLSPLALLCMRIHLPCP